MKSPLASRVVLIGEMQLAVTPAETDDVYGFIYRAAAGVEWSTSKGRFLSPSQYMLNAPNPFSPAQNFAQLAAALSSELGLRLVVSAKTAWVGVPAAVRTEIESQYVARQ